jgi:hypothetical protein
MTVAFLADMRRGDMQRDAVTHLQKTFGEVAEHGRGAVQRASNRVRDGAFVLIGAVDFCVIGLRTLGRTLANAPARISETTSNAPKSVQAAVDGLRRRGERLTDRLQGSGAIAEAEHRLGHALRGAKGAATSARRAVASGSEAVREVAGEVGAEPEARRTPASRYQPPYEERTYEELYELAVAREIDGRSKMSKDELITALRG